MDNLNVARVYYKNGSCAIIRWNDSRVEWLLYTVSTSVESVWEIIFISQNRAIIRWI